MGLISNSRSMSYSLAPKISPMLRGSRHGPFPTLLSAEGLHEKAPLALWACGHRGGTLDGTFLCKEYGVLGSVGHCVFSLARGRRTHRLRPGRSRYGSWTQNRADDPAHAGPTPHPPGVATRYHHCGRACPTRPDYLTCSRGCTADRG